MEIEIIKEVLRQYGLTTGVLAVFVSVIVSGIIGAVFIFINQRIQRNREEYLERLKATLEKQFAEYKATVVKMAENVQQAKWEIKYQACLDALDIVDAILSQYIVESEGVIPIRAPVDTIQARKCQNRLAISCENPKVAQTFTAILFPKDLRVGSIIHNLRWTPLSRHQKSYS